MKEKTRDIISALILLAVSAVGLYLSRDIPEPFREYDLGAAFLPQLVLILIGALSLLKIVVALIENKPDRVEKTDLSHSVKGFSTIVLVGLYCFCFQPVGFLLDTAVYLFVQILILVPKEKRKIWQIILIDVVATVVIYLIFTRGFSVRLPQGLIKAI